MAERIFSLAILCFLSSLCIEAKLLDKIVAVVGDNIYTLSQVKERIKGLGARKQISPLVYRKDLKGTQRNIVDIMIQGFIIRSHLESMGFVVSDEQVERQIRNMEKNLGLGREDFLQFLRKNNMTFEEYFELIRETIEFNVFQERVIKPLVSVSDQEIRNEYYKRNKHKETLSFNLTLVNFSIGKKFLDKNDLKNFQAILKTFQETGRIPEKFSTVEAQDLGEIKEEGLNPAIRKVLKNVQEGEFSRPLPMGDEYHVFFVKKKTLGLSDDFLRTRNQLRAELLLKSAENIQLLWFEKEVNKHYVRYFL